MSSSSPPPGFKFDVVAVNLKTAAAFQCAFGGAHSSLSELLVRPKLAARIDGRRSVGNSIGPMLAIYKIRWTSRGGRYGEHKHLRNLLALLHEFAYICEPFGQRVWPPPNMKPERAGTQPELKQQRGTSSWATQTTRTNCKATSATANEHHDHKHAI